MKDQLKEILKLEKKLFQELLALLDDQYKFIINNKIYELENITDKISNKGKEIAKAELQRRNVTGEISMSDVVGKYEDEELYLLYRDTKKLLEGLQIQKETNDMLIKQSLGFTNQLLNIINPAGGVPKTYSSTGKVKR